MADAPPAAPRLGARLFAIICGVLAAALAAGGIELIQVGGSPYYLVAALVWLAGAGGVWRGAAWARRVFHLLLGGTLFWALWETGGEGWGMLARVGFWVPVWLLALLVTRRPRTAAAPRIPAKAVAAAAGVAAVAALVTVGGRLIAQPAQPHAAPPSQEEQDWTAYARTNSATRFSPLAQITPANVSQLKPAWTYRTGDMPRGADLSMEFVFEATPLKVGDTLYLCTPHNRVVALDAETGQRRWEFDPKVQDETSYIKACRGVSYFKAPQPLAECAERIITGTIDARLFALDAKTGKPCSGFGQNGQVSLTTGLGKAPTGFAYLTSAPTIVGGKAIVGGWVLDGFMVGMPSGAIRAFDAVTGQFAWAWDMGRPGDNKLPPPGQTFTPGTPNSWAPMSADPELGLVYLPMGNSTPDHWGGRRSAAAEKYSSAVVALDVATGAPRWSYQTVHHDLWDFDAPSAPVLFDFELDGQKIPALAQATKHGHIYVLDRRTGQPLVPVVERPTPQGAAPGDFLSPTQPYSTAPDVMPERLTEASMWGLTPYDQLWCRVTFKKARYEGEFTPPGVRPTILFPAPYGVTDWGGATYDPDRGLDRGLYLINSSYVPMLSRLVPRKEYETLAASGKKTGHLGMAGQLGAPFAHDLQPFWSPLQVPCNAPPWGRLTALDLKAGRKVWSEALGSGRDSGPLGLKVGPPLRTGVPSMGGPTSTRGGVTFIAAALDDYFRAYDTRTGKELWRARLPAGGQASPMTYWSEASGRQFVVLAAGGHGALETRMGDYLVAYALPKTATNKTRGDQE